MATVRHLNCGTLHSPPHPRASCHCLLLESPYGLALVDTGIGLADCRDPLVRVGPEAVAAAGFQFHEAQTAIRQIEALGFQASDVRDVVLTHADPDHAGGLADFPHARVHLSAEELAAVTRGHSRYRPPQFAHGPNWRPYPTSSEWWFGLEARPLELGAGGEAYLIPLFGHTAGHCGVAVRAEGRWVLHAGDAYYLRVELTADDHPVSTVAAARAADDELRRASLAELRRLGRHHAAEIDLFGYHDFTEFPPPAVEYERSSRGG